MNTNWQKNKLESLLKSKPEERLVLPAKYNLYKIYVLLNQPGEAEITKNDIIKNHPNSRYATILLNPDSNLGEDKNSPEYIYENLYKQFEAQQYATVISESDKYISMFDGEAIVPKFEFLKAVASARLFGFEAYKKAINFIALNYPNSPEGKQAENMMQSVIPMLEKKTFVNEAESKSFKVIYPFTDATDKEIEEFTNKLNEDIKDIRYFDLSTSIDKYNANTTFVVVHGISSLQGAQGFNEILKDYKKKIDKEHFAISSDNYEVIQIHKNLDAYLESQ
jgi:hypothetical protein